MALKWLHLKHPINCYTSTNHGPTTSYSSSSSKRWRGGGGVRHLFLLQRSIVKESNMDSFKTDHFAIAAKGFSEMTSSGWKVLSSLAKRERKMNKLHFSFLFFLIDSQKLMISNLNDGAIWPKDAHRQKKKLCEKNGKRRMRPVEDVDDTFTAML